MLNAGTPARSAIDRTTFDDVHGDTPAARSRGDSKTNNAPRAEVIARRCASAGHFSTIPSGCPRRRVRANARLG